MNCDAPEKRACTSEHIIKYYKNYGILVAVEQNEQLWQCNEHTHNALGADAKKLSNCLRKK